MLLQCRRQHKCQFHSFPSRVKPNMTPQSLLQFRVQPPRGGSRLSAPPDGRLLRLWVLLMTPQLKRQGIAQVQAPLDPSSEQLLLFLERRSVPSAVPAAPPPVCAAPPAPLGWSQHRTVTLCATPLQLSPVGSGSE